MMKKLTVLAIAALLLAACGGLDSAVKKGEIAPTFTDTKVDGKYLWVRGFGAANPAHTTSAQKRIMSREAAIAQGYQRAAEHIYGTGVYAQMSVKDAVMQDSSIDNTIKGLVLGMGIYKTEYMNDDAATVIMRLSLSKLKAVNIEVK
ncbi:Uncharacterized protein conserved in bacteria DUF400 [Elusimicrobium minutum Pei191]|uniref:Uncharacterized protein conserved in bacteria DUF400 n=1 Tax=Elusimicrobium minutum (strain Pei191) TaxID=445932 RepID=B2KBN2_ELUMP|nr:hypothetical protein [Elusimicrobium minutum]ACC97719.1 Uncharacterized protein conserved in bacteria DUF400 [Elusimicrobium minutum Pei191]